MMKCIELLYKRVLIVTIIALGIIGCRPVIHVYEEKVVYKKDTINLFETTQYEIDSIFGCAIDTVNWNSYSYEMFYKRRAISFSHQQNDPLKIVKWVNAKTNKNKILFEGKRALPNNAIVKDIFEMFGEGEWSYDTTFGLAIEYEYFDFYIETPPEDKLKSSDFKESNWIKYYEEYKFHKILEIELY